VAIDCGPLGQLTDGENCTYAVIPGRSSVQMAMKVTICCASPDDKVVVNAATIAGTSISASVRTQLRH
jgi:hypothetical protein